MSDALPLRLTFLQFLFVHPHRELLELTVPHGTRLAWDPNPQLLVSRGGDKEKSEHALDLLVQWVYAALTSVATVMVTLAKFLSSVRSSWFDWFKLILRCCLWRRRSASHVNETAASAHWCVVRGSPTRSAHEMQEPRSVSAFFSKSSCQASCDGSGRLCRRTTPTDRPRTVFVWAFVSKFCPTKPVLCVRSHEREPAG